MKKNEYTKYFEPILISLFVQTKATVFFRVLLHGGLNPSCVLTSKDVIMPSDSLAVQVSFWPTFAGSLRWNPLSNRYTNAQQQSGQQISRRKPLYPILLRIIRVTLYGNLSTYQERTFFNKHKDYDVLTKSSRCQRNRLLSCIADICLTEQITLGALEGALLLLPWTRDFWPGTKVGAN